MWYLQYLPGTMATQAPTAAADILLLSERSAEVELVRMAMETSRLHVVPACGDVLPFLRNEKTYSNAPRPDLILLDLDLSRIEDCDTLVQIKQDRALRTIPVIVLSALNSRERAERAYELQANAYVIKPQVSDEFARVIRGVLEFWLRVAWLPGQKR